MDNIKLWAFSLSGALVVTSIFRLIINKSSLYKSINIFLSMFIFLYTIVPLEYVTNDLNFMSVFVDDEQTYDEFYKDGYEKIIIKAIKNICSENNVLISNINIDSYIDENGYLIVNNIEIEIDSLSQANEIVKVIYEKTGLEVNII
jgi:hypothetical protein